MLQEFEQKLDYLIDQNIDNLLNSHLHYGGVYVAFIDMGNNTTSLEVELDEGEIAFSLEVNPILCPHCGHDKFHASQQVYVNVLVSGNNHFLENTSQNMEDSVYEASNPYGPYTCQKCDLELEELPSNLVNLVGSLLDQKLRLKGVGVYTNREDWEEALIN